MEYINQKDKVEEIYGDRIKWINNIISDIVVEIGVSVWMFLDLNKIWIKKIKNKN